MSHNSVTLDKFRTLVNELEEKESHFREKATLSAAKYDESSKLLEAEKSIRIESERKLSQKSDALLEAESRIQSLEKELKKNQSCQ